MKPVTRKCRRACVEEMRHILKLDRDVQQIILGDDWQRQLTRMRQLVKRHEDECVKEWLADNWPLF